MVGPSLADIAATQDLDVNLRRQVAARHFYKIGKLVHFGGASLAVVLALSSPLVLLFQPDLGPLLGAIAGGWLFISRLFLEPFRREHQLKGAQAQELFDCTVLGIDWNDALVRRMSEEEIRKASGSLKGVERMKGWYPATGTLSWSESVLVCQRANAVWSRRQHQAYGRILAIVAGAWAVVGIAIAVADHASLGQYLTTIALPSLPALLDATEIARSHGEAASRRQVIEDQTDALLRRRGASDKDIRENQDQLFGLRRDDPLVPEWFYRLIKSNFEEDMRYAAERIDESSASTPTESR
jgi:SMODS-associating 4TM effector domain